MSSFRRIALVVNLAKPGASDLAHRLEQIAAARGVQVVRIECHPVPEGSFAGCDACCVLGGDGTLLGAVAEAVRHNVPIFGVNRGKLGFLANYPAETAEADFAGILEGRGVRDELTLLECVTADGHVYPSLNDVVIKCPEVFRLAKIGVYCGEHYVNTFRADGLVFSTPTGSTAYNLGAGGPLIVPGSDVFAMTPICPHTLTNRSVIFPANEVIRVEKEDPDSELVVSVDGLQPVTGDLFPMLIRKSSKRLPIIRPEGLSHFNILRTKLKW